MSFNESRADRAEALLHRVAGANVPPSQGEGLKPGYFIPLAHYRSRKVARLLQQKLRDQGVRFRAKHSRTQLSILVAIEDREVAFRILSEFRKSNPDTKSGRFTRDFDILLLGSFATLIIALVSSFIAIASVWAPLVVCVTGISICGVAERCRRNCRYYDGLQISTSELLWLMFIVSFNLALWRYLV
jgi:hypothetical protein